MLASVAEVVEMIANLIVGADGTEARQRARHRLRLLLALLQLVLCGEEVRQTDVALFAVRLPELERPPRYVTCHHRVFISIGESFSFV